MFRLLKTTESTTITGKNQNAYNSLVKEGFITNNNELFKNLSTNLDNKDEINNNINDYIKFYDFLKDKNLNKTNRTNSRTPYKNKQKILSSIIDKVIVYQDKNKNTLPEYKFLDANTIYKNESN